MKAVKVMEITFVLGFATLMSWTIVVEMMDQSSRVTGLEHEAAVTAVVFLGCVCPAIVPTEAESNVMAEAPLAMQSAN